MHLVRFVFFFFGGFEWLQPWNADDDGMQIMQIYAQMCAYKWPFARTNFQTLKLEFTEQNDTDKITNLTWHSCYTQIIYHSTEWFSAFTYVWNFMTEWLPFSTTPMRSMHRCTLQFLRVYVGDCVECVPKKRDGFSIVWAGPKPVRSVCSYVSVSVSALRTNALHMSMHMCSYSWSHAINIWIMLLNLWYAIADLLRFTLNALLFLQQTCLDTISE